jgi:TetR/AcrR family transcriptional repressor of nem operon
VLALDTHVRGVIVYRPVGQMPPSEESRKRLVQTAVKLFASRGYHNTSIADILRESGCTRGVLYHYFPSKEELGYAAIDEGLRLAVAQGTGAYLQTNEHPIDRISKALDALPNTIKLGAVAVSTTDLSIRMASVHEGFRKRLEGWLEPTVDQVDEVVHRGIADGQIADSVDPRQLTHVLVTMGVGIQHMSLLWHREVISQNARRWLKDYLNSLRR